MARQKKQTETPIEAVEITEETAWDLTQIETVVSEPDETEVNSSENVDINHPKWHEYVLSLFTEDELDNGNPKVNGLRRVAQLLLGDIMYSGPINVYAPETSDSIGRATVVYKIEFAWRLGVKFADITFDRFSLPIKTFVEVADVWSGNADRKYAIHTTSLASTRAEARALRKALNLRCVAAEELVSSSIDESPADFEPMTANQQAVINAKCLSMGIDIEKLAKYIGLVSPAHKWTKADGNKLMSKINQLQTNLTEDSQIPEEIKV
jgi:hypothetical protein